MQVSQLCHIINSTWWCFSIFGIYMWWLGNNLELKPTKNIRILATESRHTFLIRKLNYFHYCTYLKYGNKDRAHLYLIDTHCLAWSRGNLYVFTSNLNNLSIYPGLFWIFHPDKWADPKTDRHLQKYQDLEIIYLWQVPILLAQLIMYPLKWVRKRTTKYLGTILLTKNSCIPWWINSLWNHYVL